MFQRKDASICRNDARSMLRRYSGRFHPANLAGVLRTAIGSASLAEQLAVRSTRAQHLERWTLPAAERLFEMPRNRECDILTPGAGHHLHANR